MIKLIAKQTKHIFVCCDKIASLSTCVHTKKTFLSISALSPIVNVRNLIFLFSCLRIVAFVGQKTFPNSPADREKRTLKILRTTYLFSCVS